MRRKGTRSKAELLYPSRAQMLLLAAAVLPSPVCLARRGRCEDVHFDSRKEEYPHGVGDFATGRRRARRHRERALVLL